MYLRVKKNMVECIRNRIELIFIEKKYNYSIFNKLKKLKKMENYK